MRRLVRLLRTIIALLENPSRQAQAAVRRGQKAREQSGHTPLIAELHIPRAAIEKYTADQEAQNALEQRRLDVDRERLALERITLAVVVAGAFGAFFNLWLLDQTTDAALASAGAAQTQASAAQQQTALLRRSVYAGQRAYMVSSNAHLRGPLRIGNPITAGTEVKNTGQTPAVDVRVWSATFVFDAPLNFIPEDVRARVPIDESKPTGVAVLGKDQTTIALHMQDPEAPLVDKTNLDAINAGSSRLFLYGIIRWKDVFNSRCYTRYCHYFNALDRRFYNCHSGQEIRCEESKENEGQTKDQP
jgi:hypothetical protein